MAEKVSKKAAKAEAKKAEQIEKAAKKAEKKAAQAEAKAKAKLPKKAAIAEIETKINDEIVDLAENFAWDEIADAISTLDFFVDHRSDECGEKNCDNLRTTQQYCRLHYISNWQDIKRKREILKEGKLQEYIEELINKYPPKYIESILGDLQDDKDFFKALGDLNIASEIEFDEDGESTEEGDDDDSDIEVETRSFASKRFEDE